MTKYQRAKARITRDKACKAEKHSEKFKYSDNFNSVISTQHYVEALGKCRKGVSWKGSVQKYTQNAVVEISRTINSLENGVLPELSSVNRIVLYERGKRREIVPITIRDRMTQRVLCDNALVPVLQNALIYDNGASMKGKGVDFTRKRLLKHLRDAVKAYGSALSRKMCKFLENQIISFCPPLEWSVAERRRRTKNGVRLSARISRYVP